MKKPTMPQLRVLRVLAENPKIHNISFGLTIRTGCRAIAGCRRVNPVTRNILVTSRWIDNDGFITDEGLRVVEDFSK